MKKSPRRSRPWAFEWPAHRSLPSGFFNGRGDEVAVFGPTAIVVLHVVDADEIFHYEPRVAGALADAAIGDGVLLRVHALLLAVNAHQVVGGFERAIGGDRGAPRNAFRAGDVAAALRGFTHAGR